MRTLKKILSIFLSNWHVKWQPHHGSLSRHYCHIPLCMMHSQINIVGFLQYDGNCGTSTHPTFWHVCVPTRVHEMVWLCRELQGEQVCSVTLGACDTTDTQVWQQLNMRSTTKQICPTTNPQAQLLLEPLSWVTCKLWLSLSMKQDWCCMGLPHTCSLYMAAATTTSLPFSNSVAAISLINKWSSNSRYEEKPSSQYLQV